MHISRVFYSFRNEAKQVQILFFYVISCARKREGFHIGYHSNRERLSCVRVLYWGVNSVVPLKRVNRSLCVHGILIYRC